MIVYCHKFIKRYFEYELLAHHWVQIAIAEMAVYKQTSLGRRKGVENKLEFEFQTFDSMHIKYQLLH